jgi:multidrug efflux pump subunit AcrA (membrane-fusion protein)
MRNPLEFQNAAGDASTPRPGAVPVGTSNGGGAHAGAKVVLDERGGEGVPHAATGVSGDEKSPFGTPSPHGARRRLLTIGTFVLALAGAVAAVYYATRDNEPAVAPGGHAHGGAGPAAATASPVMLTREGAERIGVTYATAEMTTLAREVRTVGLVTYDETLVKAISPKIDGWVEQLYLNYTGQAVSRGEPLFSIYSPMLVTAQEELLLAQRLTHDVADGSPDAQRSASDLLASARRRLTYWDVPAEDIAAIERSGEVRRTLTLRSPVSGFVVDKPVLSGQRIMAGDAVYRIADLSTVWVEGEVFEQDAAIARPGALVAMEFTALPGRTRTGRVTYVYPTLNQQTRTMRVRVALSNPGAALKPGMYATLRLTSPGTDRVLTVPRSAVLSTGTRTLVFVRQPDGTLVPRDVTLGQTTETRVQVLSGLAAGDVVVASATFLIDAESNLKSALGGMGNMPGMGTGTSTDAPAPATKIPAATSTPSGSAMPDMPGMPATSTPPGAPASSTAPAAGHSAHGGA